MPVVFYYDMKCAVYRTVPPGAAVVAPVTGRAHARPIAAGPSEDKYPKQDNSYRQQNDHQDELDPEVLKKFRNCCFLYNSSERSTELTATRSKVP